MAGDYDFNDDYDRDTGRDVRVPESESGFADAMRRLTRRVTGILATCFIIALLAGGAYLSLIAVFEAPGPLSEERTVLIERGQGLREIADRLQQEGIIRNDKVFILGVLANRANGKLKAGEYLFAAEDSMRTVMNALVAGRSLQYTITFAEGLTSQQIVNRINANEVLLGEIGQVPAEGSLLPDTYSFTRGMERQAIIDRMREAQEKLLAELWPERSADLPIGQPHEALILASIVEKETGVSSERAHVASVFINRLRRGMRLQSDPTIIYGIVGGAGPLGRPITRSDINGVTPYNTYQIDGLPPTPIANPGRASIEAVLRPADSNDIFFVADGTGGHVFAETLEEHNRNVARWREIERELRAEAAAASAGRASDGETQGGSDATAADAGIDDGSVPGASDEPGEAASASPSGDAEPEVPAEAAATPDTDAATDAGAATDGADAAAGGDDGTADAGDAADTAPEEPAAEPAEPSYPLPEPKPEPPRREGSRTGPSDITVVPLPTTSAN